MDWIDKILQADLNVAIPKYYNLIKNKIVNVYNHYKGRPDILMYDIRGWYAKFIYESQNFVDPMPLRGKAETDRDYFDRIDPKYGLRFYGCIKKGNLNRDLRSTMEDINQNYSKKDSEVLKELLLTITEIEANSNENYERYVARKKILQENQNS